MEPEARLAVLLELAADGADEAHVDAERVVQLANRRRRTRLVGCVAVVILLGAGTILVAASQDRRQVVTTGLPPSHSATAADLVDGRWTTAPVSPLSPRTEALVIWAGDRLVVWSGIATTPTPSHGGNR